MRRIRRHARGPTGRRWSDLWWAGLLIWFVVGAAACSTEEPLPPRSGQEDTSEPHRRVGSLLAEFEGDAERARDVSIHAQFLDVQGVEVDRALEALEVWSVATELDRDACSMRPGQAPPGGTVRDRDVRLDLLSVGAIDVRGPERSIELQARRLPDLLSAFSGVIYGTDRSFGDEKGEPLEFEPGAPYTFYAPGDGSTGGFEVTLEAPQSVELQPVSARWTASKEAVALQRGQDFEFRWNAPEGAESDLFFDIAAGYGPDQPRLQCRLEDDGQFSVPAELLGELGEQSSTLQVALRRASRKNVDIAGLEESDFTLSTVDRLTLELY